MPGLLLVVHVLHAGGVCVIGWVAVSLGGSDVLLCGVSVVVVRGDPVVPGGWWTRMWRWS